MKPENHDELLAKKITSMDLNDKTIASLQRNMSSGTSGRYKKLPTNEIMFGNYLA